MTHDPEPVTRRTSARRAPILAFPMEGVNIVLSITRGAAKVLATLLEGRDALVLKVEQQGLEASLKTVSADPESASERKLWVEFLKTRQTFSSLMAQLTEDLPARRVLVDSTLLPELGHLLGELIRDACGDLPAPTTDHLRLLLMLATGHRPQWVYEFMDFAGRVRHTTDWVATAAISPGHFDCYLQRCHTQRRQLQKIGRNNPCSCGATDARGRPIKFKRCCG